MKDWLKNCDRDAVCFMVVVMMCMGIAGGVAVDMVRANPVNKNARELKKMSYEPCDGTCVELPARTNTGDTLLVLGREMKGDKLRAVDTRGQTCNYKIDGAKYVNPGDTIVVDKKHQFLMKNITQNHIRQNFVKQK